MKITGLMAIATFTVTVAAGSGMALAETTSVSRCNFSEGAAYKPGLRITKDGETRLIKVGEQGLTRRIIFDDALARKYVRAQLSPEGGASNVSFTNACSSSATYSYAEDDDAVVVADVEVPPTRVPPTRVPPDRGPTDCGPTDCGPTDCGPSCEMTKSC